MLHKSFSLEKFIGQHITGRANSLFDADLAANHDTLTKRIKGKSALVIGGAGTIGSSYIKALLRYQPAKLIVVDTNENGLTELVRDLRSTYGQFIPTDLRTYPLNFGNPVFHKLLQQEGRFDIVANFAAHKHVRSEKDRFSIEAMVENNVFQAADLLHLLMDYPPDHFFCVSTDKAANPVNIMGGSKKLMEEVILTYSEKIPITTARFANVAFSNGSLLDGFVTRLFKKQPLSSPMDIRRFFVSPRESGELCLCACMLGNSGEIFFPKLEPDQMESFDKIAVDFLHEFGYEPQYCASEEEARKVATELGPDSKLYPVYFFKSDTSGEKPYEEFFTPEEKLDLDRFKELGVIVDAPHRNMGELKEMLADLQGLFKRDGLQKEDIVHLMANFLGNFEHIETGKNLDQKM